MNRSAARELPTERLLVRAVGLDAFRDVGKLEDLVDRVFQEWSISCINSW